MTGLERMLYVDDSQEELHSGTIVFGWVECHPARWRNALRVWLEHRKRVFAEFGVPPSEELHATDILNGRGGAITNTERLDERFFGEGGKVLKKDVGRALGLESLKVLASCSDLSVGSVYIQTDARGSAFAVEKQGLYRRLVQRWEHDLGREDVFALVAMDGEDRHYATAHRELKLDRRRIIEDPVMQDSVKSQWMQMADLVAYTALMHLNRHRHNEFGWHWYEEHLAASDRWNGPVELP